MLNAKKFTPTTNHYELLPPWNLPAAQHESYSAGGVALGDVSQGWRSHVWKAECRKDGIYVGRTDQEAQQVLEVQATQVSLCLDQNMNLVLAYTDSDKQAHLYAYGVSGYESRPLVGVVTPQVALDRLHHKNAADSDVIVGYMRGDSLYYLVQREGYRIEHKVATDPSKTMLWRMGLNADERMVFQWR